MFVLSRNVSASFRVIATLVATALLLWSFGLHSIAQAANITYVKDTLSDSSPNAESNHTIEFKIPSGLAAAEDIVVTFPAGFVLTGVVEDDVDLEINGTDAATAGTASGATWGVSFAGQVLTIESGTGTIANTATVTIKIGTHATSSGTGANQINNPDPADGNESYEIDISAGTDSGSTRVVVLDTVLVTAQVNTSFTFEVQPNGTGEAVNGETTDIASGSTTIPFGPLDAGTPVVISQDLVVNTNAIHGFVVTVEEDGHLESSTGADIDNFANNNNAVIPAAWGALAPDIDDENTWGHWGITSEDATTTRTNEFGTNEWLGVSTTPSVIFSHTGPADGVTPGIGSTTVGYKVEITALQEAADDYSAILTYIATPTF
jgi:hypothetical protein